MTQDAELAFYLNLCGSDFDKLGYLEIYLTLLAARDDEDGVWIESIDAQIFAVRAELRYQLGL